MVTGPHPRCPLPPHPSPPPRRGEGGGDAVRDFYATFRFTFQISCIGCLRIAGALPFLIPFINSKFLFILFPTYNPIKLTSA